MRRSRKPFRAVSSDEGSNPSPSAAQAKNRITRRFTDLQALITAVHDQRLEVRKVSRDCTSLARKWPAVGLDRPGQVVVQQPRGLGLVAGHQVAVAVQRDRD
jgi:hypothetical protein